MEAMKSPCLLIFLYQICASSIVFAVSKGHLDGLLNVYETLHSKDVISSHVTKRSADLQNIYRTEHHISFSSFGRIFRLYLYQQEGLFSSNLFAAEIGRNQTREIYLDETQFFSGFLDGESRDLKVFAYWEDNKNLVAVIRTRNDTYFIEPSWRHLPEAEKNYTMIVYRLSDIKKIHPEMLDHHMAFCNPPEINNSYIPFEGSKQFSNDNGDSVFTGRRKRTKRDSDVKSSHAVCSVMLVADYHFFETVGDSSVANTAKYMIGVLTRVNNIYMGTDFGLKFGVLGFEIEGIIVNSSPTQGNESYNKQTTSWDTNELLNAFSSNSEWKKYCLVHLFTSVAFDNGVLGLAWVASNKIGSLGGICSQCSNGKCYNTGWSTSMNKFKNRLVVLEADLVTAHGHGWGAQHDPDRSECSPSAANDGKYIMYPFSVAGRDPNNDKFSPCSRTSISSVLEAKRDTCFVVPRTGFCGNNRVDVNDNEQCDAGPLGKAGIDKCCDNECKFVAGAICSDANSDCCENCTYAPQTKNCWTNSTNYLSESCRANSFCTGSNDTCPKTFLPDGTPCSNNGHCKNGVCQNICEYSNLTSCVCDDVVNSCMWCCKNSVNDTCQLVNDNETGSVLNVADGYPCQQGYCQSGKCQKSIQTKPNRAWDFIQQLSANQIRIFLRNNLVLATVILSLIPYLIFCFFIYYLDHKKLQKANTRRAWLHKDNNRLILNENSSHVRSINGVIYRSNRS